VLKVPLVFQVAPGKPFGRFPVAITVVPLSDPGPEPVVPSAGFSCIYLLTLTVAFGHRRARGKRREHLRLVLRKEFDYCLSALRTADKELVADKLDAQSRFLSAMHER
jgi:hypothetical protein